jgi:lysophospholipase L1-like esterase
MKLIADIGRQFGVKVIFVPEMANYHRLTTDRIRGWLPLVRDKDIKSLLTAMDRDLARAAKESGAAYLGAPLDQDWVDADFTDDVHFSAAGARKFAQSLAPEVASLCH